MIIILIGKKGGITGYKIVLQFTVSVRKKTKTQIFYFCIKIVKLLKMLNKLIFDKTFKSFNIGIILSNLKKHILKLKRIVVLRNTKI